MKKQNIYALYKGDRFIDMGTREYLANLLKCKVRTISFFATPAYKKRIRDNSNAIIVIKVED